MEEDAHGKFRIKVTIAIFGASAAIFLALVLANNTGTMAATPAIVTARPLSESSDIVKIKNVAVLAADSVNPDVLLKAVPSGLGISLIAENNGASPAKIDVDQWEASINGESWIGGSEPVSLSTNAIIPAKGSVTISQIDLSKHRDALELFPGTYSLELAGWKWHEKDFGTYTKSGNWKDYVLRADVVVDYDINAIRASTAKLLKSDGMQVGIEGPGNLFEVDQNSPKKVSFYLANDGKAAVSGMVTGAQFNVWHSENRFPSVASTTIAEPNPGMCEVLNPGEKKMIDGYEFSKTAWPIGANGIAEQLGSDTAMPGLYIAHLQAKTSPCTTPDGQQVPGGSYSAIVAFEVRP